MYALHNIVYSPLDFKIFRRAKTQPRRKKGEIPAAPPLVSLSCKSWGSLQLLSKTFQIQSHLPKGKA